jgi:short subunit dehydrogenase-like uncharacterized protein
VNRPYDIVLFGATGFTGALTAEYLAAHATGTWALAGRDPARLTALRDRLGRDLPLLRADVGDASSLREIAESARVVISTVGPYLTYGEPLVAACARAGTDYVDLTGEPEFVDLMYLRYHAQAASTGARLVHACGFDSLPHDLGVYFTVRHLPEDVPLRVRGYVQLSAAPSAGTVHSAITVMGRLGTAARIHRRRLAAEPAPAGRRVRAVRGRPHHAAGLRAWALPLPTIDPDVIRRSAAALDRYGPDFAYSHFAAVRHLPSAVGLTAGMAGLAAAARVGPVRDRLLERFTPGEGPSPERRAKSWFRLTFAGEGGGHEVVTRVSGGDPGYDETARMLAECALCLAFDDLPQVAGQVTTAEAMGDALLARLRRAGLRFTLVGSAG